MNCLLECRQSFIINSCNCNPEILYPIVPSVRGCRISDVKCLYDVNGFQKIIIATIRHEIFQVFSFFFVDQMNYEKPTSSNVFFSDVEPGRVCDCLPDCRQVEYTYGVIPSQITNS